MLYPEEASETGFCGLRFFSGKDPNNVQTLNNYAYHLSTRGVQLQRAVKLAQRATEIEPHNTIYLDTYAWALYKAGKYAEAKAVTDSMWVAFEKEGQSDKPDAGYYDRSGRHLFQSWSLERRCTDVERGSAAY